MSFVLVLPSGNGILEENFAEQVLSPRILHPWKRDCEYKYNLDIDLGMGNWISSGKNDELLFSKKNKPTSTREKAVTSLLKKKHQPSSASSYVPKKKLLLADSSNCLQFLLMMSKLVKKHHSD